MHEPLERPGEVCSDRVGRTEMTVHTAEVPQALQLVKIRLRNQSKEEIVVTRLTVSTLISENIERHHMVEAKCNSPRRHRGREAGVGRGHHLPVC